MGFKNREVYHNTDWDAVAKNPEIMGKMVGDWLVHHGYTYKPWTVKELLNASESGEPVEDEGDWS
jgi:hypothetical protein